MQRKGMDRAYCRPVKGMSFAIEAIPEDYLFYHKNYIKGFDCNLGLEPPHTYTCTV